MNVLRFKSFDDSIEKVSFEDSQENKQIIWNSNKDDVNSLYLQDYLKTVTERLIKADFLIGDNNLITKEGILKEVGTDYIILEMLQSNDLLACDIYSIKFVQIL